MPAARGVTAALAKALSDGYHIVPGLINAHDHLEFNLFPRLGRGVYRNAGEWARDIYHPERSPVREQLRVPKEVRLWWGGLKNLVSGVTTVCHHNPYEASVFGADFPVRVVRRFGWAHSLEFEPDLAARFRKARADYPFIVHCGEGTDRKARGELGRLDEMGVVDGRTVVVHGVSLDVELMRRRGAGLVWCPSSNLGMLGRTVSRTVLRSGIPIALGTDSALSAPVDLQDELRVARRYVPADRLLEMVTSTPARLLRLARLSGDWVAIRSSAATAAEALVDGQVALVVARGRVRLIDPELGNPRGFQALTLEGRPTVLVDADVKALRRAAARHLGGDFRVAGKRVL